MDCPNESGCSDLLVFFSLILFSNYLYLVFSLLCLAWQHKGGTLSLAHTTEAFWKTWDSWKVCHLPSVRCQQHLFLANWGTFLHQISSSVATLLPLDLPTEPWTEAICLKELSFRKYLYHLSKIFNPPLGKQQLWKTGGIVPYLQREHSALASTAIYS